MLVLSNSDLSFSQFKTELAGATRLAAQNELAGATWSEASLEKEKREVLPTFTTLSALCCTPEWSS